jgi:hypothetical protein
MVLDCSFGVASFVNFAEALAAKFWQWVEF